MLLKNENVLPIGRAEKIALIGPNADDIYRQIGDYSPPMDRAGYETLKSGMEKNLVQTGFAVIMDMRSGRLFLLRKMRILSCWH